MPAQPGPGDGRKSARGAEQGRPAVLLGEVMMRLRSLGLVVLCLSLVLGTGVTRVLAGATGGIRVIVYEVTKDGQKSPLPGATVVLADANHQFPQTAKMTDANGQAIFPVVPVGSAYIVVAQMPGYAAARQTGVRVIAGQTQNVVLALTEQITEVVEVKAKRKVVDLEKSATSTEFSDEFVSDLPIMGRDVENIFTLAPGVNDADGDGNPNVHGSRDRDFKVMVDNVSNVDPLTGQFMQEINPDSIEEIQVVDSGADASYGGAVGAFAKVVTKSGGNEFEGTFNIFLRDSSFENDAAGNTDPLDFKVFQPSLSLGGPIIKDHLWYFISHEYRGIQVPILVIGGNNFTQTRRLVRSADKITWQVTPKNKLQFQYRADPLIVKPAGVNSITPKESGFTYESGGPTYQLVWTAPFSSSFFFEATVAYSDMEVKYRPYDPNARNACMPASTIIRDDTQHEPTNHPYITGLDWTRQYCMDRNLGSQRSGTFWQTYKDQRQRWSYLLDAEQFISDWLGGSHRVKAGFSLMRVRYWNRENIRPFVEHYEVQHAGALGMGGSANNVSDYYNINGFIPRGQEHEALGNYYAVYINDTYEPRPNLSISVGLRFSREEFDLDGYHPFSPKTEQGAFEDGVRACYRQYGYDPDGYIPSWLVRRCTLQNYWRFTAHPMDDPYAPGVNGSCGFALNYRICSMLRTSSRYGDLHFRAPEEFSIVNNNLAPRLSISWDPGADGKSKVWGSWGRFYGETFLAPLVAETGPDRHISRAYRRQLTPDTVYLDTQYSSSFSITQVARNLRSQFNDEWTVGYEREIAPETSFKIRYIHRQYRDQLQDTDINHRPVYWDDLTPEDLAYWNRVGRGCRKIGPYADCTGTQVWYMDPNDPWHRLQLKYTPDGIADLQPISPMFNNVYLIGNFNHSTYQAWILEVTRRFYQNWELQASYTWSKAWGQAEDFNQGLGDDPTNADDEQGPLAFDQRHIVRINGRVFIPKWGGFRIGGSFRYETGLPYSKVEQRNVLDYPYFMGGTPSTGGIPLSYFTPRTVYPSHQRNDNRNASFWTLNVNFQKEFHIKDMLATVQVDVFNLLNDDTLFIDRVQLTKYYEGGVEKYYERLVAGRRWGRQFQLAFKLKF